ncbi:MAG: M48 family metalloprotease [Treponema sp.]|nr:M48 family metalloprotease [Treponema sp.]MCL2252249.1 M48 family metalloprotease [Treponema sp.]
MKKKTVFILLVLMISIMFVTCQHVDSLAQAAARNDILDPDTANMISISARAFGAAAEQATPEQEYFIGRAVAANILSNYKIWNGSQELTDYLNLICAAIVINSPQPNLFSGYHVAILDSNEVNAFATSGGHIFVTRGLINVSKTEDALAGVIAHEVAHIQLRHGVKAIKNNRVTEAILLTATTAVGNALGMNVEELSDVFNESVGEIVQTMVGSGYSKEQEYEADIAAMYLMALAGYQPSGLLDMLREIDAVHIGSSGFGKTHPAPKQRIYFAEKALNRFEIADNRLERQNRFNDALKLGLAEK